MRIGEINQANYTEFLKIFGIKADSVKLPNKAGTSAAVKDKPFIEPGMDITGRTEADWRIVEVSDDIRGKIIDLARKEFIGNYGMTDGEELNALIKQYIINVPVSDKADAAWTLGLIFRNESTALTNKVKESDPNWNNGQPFDRSVLYDYINGNGNLDVRI